MARETLWRRLWTGALALVWAVINVRAFDESDVFWHAAFGREIARQHTRTFAEPFSFAAVHASSQEWLWDVATYILHGRFGWNGVAVLVVALAALGAIAVANAAWEFRPSLAALVATTALVSPPILSRVRERPETAAMVLLPLILGFAHRLATARTAPHRVRAAVIVAALQLLFVQLHPLFVLGPIVVAVIAGPELALGSRHAQRTGVGLVLVCGLAFATNLPALAAIVSHLGGYSVEHVTDMQPPRWRHLDPTDSPFFPAYLAIGLASIVAMAKARRVFGRALVLALIGAAIALRARRGVGPGAIFAIPLAMQAFEELFASLPANRSVPAVLAGALYVLARTAQWFDASSEGGLGVMGVNPAAAPTAAARVLDSAPPETHVLTTFSAGAGLAFLLDHRVRTFVDSRTPLVFGDAAYGEARAVWSAPDSLARATPRFALEAAVVERESMICQQLEVSPAWGLLMVEPGFSTFVRRAGPLGATKLLTTVRACSGERLRPEACKDPASLDADLEAIAASNGQGFTDLLRAQRLVACSAQNFDADATVRLLEPREKARGFLVERDALLAWVYAMAKHEDEVRAIVLPYLDRPFGFRTPEPMFPALRALLPTKSSRPLFELALEEQDDASLGWLEAKVALACMADGDRACTELHARRAAVFGAREVTPALCWLRDEGSKQWLDVLHQTCR